MNYKDKAVFFDCWNTVISFKEGKDNWTLKPLYVHTLNKEDVDFNVVEKFLKQFTEDYYLSGSFYEITAEAMYRMICMNFDLQLDCPLETIVKESLYLLEPDKIEGVEEFLKLLDERGVYYAILSNTIYHQKDTINIVNSLIKKNNFKFLLASSDVGVKKPNLRFFNTGLALAKKKAENSIYIGDSFFADVYGSYLSKFNNSIWLNSIKKSVDSYSFIKEYKEIKYVEAFSYFDVIELFKTGKLWN